MLLAGLLLFMPAAASGEPKPPVMLMTGLPLVWGEKGPFDPGSRPAGSYRELRETFSFEPVDVLDRPTLARGKLLFLAQPQRLAPAELAALDGWIRDGGRALILTDPMLTWPSGLPLGDIRRPPPVGLLDPLLHHWRLALDSPAEPRRVEAVANGRRLAMDSPGRFRTFSRDCVVGPEWTAVCSIGRGRVRLVADADLMRDDLWAPQGLLGPAPDNSAVVGEWLDELAGTPPPRPRLPVSGRHEATIAFGLLLVFGAAAAGLLLRASRKR